MNQAKVRIMARITARDDTSSELRAILCDLAGPSRGEGGCIGYELLQNQDDPREFVTIEEWVDQAAADAHMVTPHVVLAVSKAGDLLDQAPQIHRFAPIA